MASAAQTVEIPEAFGFLFDPPLGGARYRVGKGGRAGGKSHSFVKAALLHGAAQPLRIGCYREIQKSIKDSAKRLIDDQIDQLGLGKFYTSTDTEVRGINGTLFLFDGLRSNPDKIKSTEGLDLAIVFEANKVAQRSWDLLIPTVRKPKSEIWAEYNPDLPTDPVDAMFCGDDGPPPNSIVRTINFRDNPFFPDVLKAEMEHDRRRDPDKYLHVWEGEYRRNSEARVFKNWAVEEFDAPNDALFRYGADWGFSIDPSALVRCYVDGRKLYIDWEAVSYGCEIDQLPALFDHVPDARRWLITADSSRPETISYMQRQGFKIMPAIKGARSVEEGVEFLKAYDIIVHPRCQHAIRELTHYSYKIDELTGQVIPILADKDNHIIDAVRYALEGARRASKPEARTIRVPVPTRNPTSWMAA
jgi:phage terminase large subunit